MEESKTLDIKGAVKWSAFAEIIAKLIGPITSIILARLLTPEAFGIVASVTMVTSFCDLFTDVGCNKYIIQHTFKDDIDLSNNASVAFWTNIMISFVFWISIFILRSQISSYIGLDGEPWAIVIASLSLIMTAFSSVQVAIMRKELNFKKLFRIRLVVTLTTLVVSAGFALAGAGFWALIVGNLARDLINALLFTYYSIWRPSFYYSIKNLYSMLSFSAFALVETLVTWMKVNISILILTATLTSYLLGLYKTAITIDNSIIGLLYSSIVPVLYSALSKVKNDIQSFRNILFRMQKLMAMLAFPIGMIIFVYHDLVTKLLLGSQWGEVAAVLGLYGLALVVENVFCIFCVEAYSAAGKPLYSAIRVGLNALCLGVSLWFVRYESFDIICEVTLLNSVIYYFVQMIIMKIVLSISPFAMLNNVRTCICITGIIGLVSYLSVSLFVFNQIAMAIISGLSYIGVLVIIPSTRVEIKKMLK